MDPNNQNPQPQTPFPGGPSPSSGSDWQKEAVIAARIVSQPPPPPPAEDVPPQIPGVPDWQQGFQQHKPPAQPDVPDVLAPADPAPPPPRPAPSHYVPQPPPTTPPLPGNAVGQPVVFGDFGAAPSAAPLPQPMAAGKPLPVKKVLLWGGVGLTVLTITAVALVIFLGNGNKSIKDANNKSNSLSNAIDMSVLSNVSFTVPNSLDGYTYDQTTSTDTYATYLNSTKTCALGFGTVPPNTFPGNTVEEMVNAQIQNLRTTGATADGPDAGEPLVLKTTDGKSSYKMPTLNFTFSKNNATGKVHYSIVILKNKRLAIVNRQCGNENGSVADSDMSGLDDRAKSLQVNLNETAN